MAHVSPRWFVAQMCPRDMIERALQQIDAGWSIAAQSTRLYCATFVLELFRVRLIGSLFAIYNQQVTPEHGRLWVRP